MNLIHVQILVEASIPYNEFQMDHWKFGHNKITASVNNKSYEFQTKSVETIRQSIESYMIDLEKVIGCFVD